jgi:hypothetical protein
MCSAPQHRWEKGKIHYTRKKSRTKKYADATGRQINEKKKREREYIYECKENRDLLSHDVSTRATSAHLITLFALVLGVGYLRWSEETTTRHTVPQWVG